MPLDHMEALSKDEELERKKVQRIVDSITPRYTIRDYLDPLFKKNLPVKGRKLCQHVAEFHNKYSYILDDLNLSDYPAFKAGKTTSDVSRTDDGIIYECTGADPKEVHTLITGIEVDGGYNPTMRPEVKPYTVIIPYIIRYYLQKNDKKSAQLMMYYFGYSLYWMAYTTTFPKFKPRKEVVEYTLNTIGNKFILKQLGSINRWIYYAIDRIVTTHYDLLMDGSDYGMVYIVTNARTKIGNLMKTIGNPIHENQKNKNLVFVSNMQNGEGKNTESESDSEVIFSLADKYTSYFFSQPISRKALVTATYKAEIGADEIRSAIENIKEDTSNYDQVKAFYIAVFTLFLKDGKYKASDIKTLQFVAYINNAYKKGNTADPSMLVIRDSLNDWLTKASPLYRALSRPASQSSFRKAIYLYMTYSVISSD